MHLVANRPAALIRLLSIWFESIRDLVFALELSSPKHVCEWSESCGTPFALHALLKSEAHEALWNPRVSTHPEPSANMNPENFLIERDNDHARYDSVGAFDSDDCWQRSDVAPQSKLGFLPKRRTGVDSTDPRHFGFGRARANRFVSDTKS